jgi:hypothetical protein
MTFFPKFFKSSKVDVAEIKLDDKTIRESLDLLTGAKVDVVRGMLSSKQGRDRLSGLISSINPDWKAASVLKIILQAVTSSDSLAIHKIYRDYFETAMLTEEDARKALKNSRPSINAFLKKPDTSNVDMLFVAKLIQSAEKKLPAYSKTEKMTKDLSSWWRRAYFNLFVFQSYPVLNAAKFIHNAFKVVDLSKSPTLEKIYDDHFAMLIQTEDGARNAFKNAEASAKAFLDNPDATQGAMIYIAEKIQKMAKNIIELEEMHKTLEKLRRQRVGVKVPKSNEETPPALRVSQTAPVAGGNAVNALNQEEVWEQSKNLPNVVDADAKQSEESEYETPRSPRTP